MYCVQTVEESDFSENKTELIEAQPKRKGYRYKKSGVMLLDLSAKRMAQEDLFEDTQIKAKSARLMRVMDQINQTWGRGSLRSGASGFEQPWAMRAEHRSPRYTTRWDELPVVR